MKSRHNVKRALPPAALLLLAAALLCLMTACGGGTDRGTETGADTADGSETAAGSEMTDDPSDTREEPGDTDAPDTLPDTEPVTEPETRRPYEDIGEGRFTVDKELYYIVTGRPLAVTGSFDFDERDNVPLTFTCDQPDAVRDNGDGTLTVLRPGDWDVTVREEKYGTTAVTRLCAVGELTDNIIISVPVWRDKWNNQEQYGYMKDAGVDMVVAVSGVENTTFEQSRHMLKEALQTWGNGRGLRVLVHSTTELLDNVLPKREAQLRRMMNGFADEPALAGYHLIDEPYEANPYAPVQRVMGLIDPWALTDVNFLPGGAYPSMTDYEHRMDDYCRLLGEESRAYLSFDNYPFGGGEGSVNEDALFGNFEAVRRAGLATHTRTAFYLQAVGGFGNAYRRPDAATLTYHTASALAYGFKWIKYWSWFVPDYGDPEATYNDYTDAIIGKDGKPTDLYPVACDLHLRAHTIGPILVACEAEEVYHTGRRSTAGVYTKVPDTFFAQPTGQSVYAILSLLCDRTTGRQYLMIVNKDMTKAADMSFVLSGVDELTLIDTRTGEGQTLTLTDQTLSLTLEAGDFAFFALPEGDFRTPADPNPNLAASARVTVNASVGRDGYFSGCALDGLRTSTDDAKGWRVEGTSGEMLFVFDAPVTINRVDLYPAGEGVTFGSAFPSSVRLLTAPADDPDNWTEVFSAPDVPRPTTEVPVLRFNDVTASRFKLVLDHAGLPFETAEIELYRDDGSIPLPGPTSFEEVVQEKGENVALHKTPIASGSAYESTVDAWGLAYLTDGSRLRTERDGTNGWMSNGVRRATDEAWGGVDLGAAYKLNEVDVYPRESGGFFPSAYDIQISDDFVNWTTVVSVDNDTETRGVGRFFPLDRTYEARYVRVVSRRMTGGVVDFAGGYLMQISEIEVYWK